jgi:putative FmdB family regulatory protein
MPIYEYKCGACDQTFEYMQRVSDAPKSECEGCGGALERLISNTSFQLKGGGWYSDLYASPKPDSAKNATGSAKTDSGGSSEPKSTAKADSK